MAYILKREYTTKSGEKKTRYYVIGNGPDGKRVSHSKHTHSKDARAELHRVQVMEDAGTYQAPNANITFEELVDEYLQNYVKPRLKPRTLDDYTTSLKAHAVPFFGSTKLRSITPKMVADFVAELAAETTKGGKPYSPRRTNKNLTLVKQVFNVGVEWGYIERSPAANVKPVPSEHKEAEFLDISEVQRFLKSAETEPEHYAMFATAVLAGLRMGELAGLQRGDIDLVKGVIYVRRQYHPKYGFTAPKSWAGVRPVPLCEHLRGILSEYMDGTDGELDDVLFVNRHGKAIDLNVLTKYTDRNRGRETGAFKRVLEDAGLRLVNFHSLRHSYAAILIHAGVTPKALQSVMGHSTISVTLDVYGHLYGDYLDGVVEKMDALVFDRNVVQFPMERAAEG